MFNVQLHKLAMVTANDPLPGLNDVPAMQRRRLSPLTKLALNSAVQARADYAIDTIIWASQFGDEEKTSQILLDVAQGNTPSPTQFSTSVNNAIAGLYSILFQDRTPAISLSGGLREALLEALAQLRANPSLQHALLVVYDQALPDIYQQAQAFEAFSLALVVSLDPNGLLQLNPEALSRCADNHRFDNHCDVQAFRQRAQSGSSHWHWP